jgi:hypothetical protein
MEALAVAPASQAVPLPRAGPALAEAETLPAITALIDQAEVVRSGGAAHKARDGLRVPRMRRVACQAAGVLKPRRPRVAIRTAMAIAPNATMPTTIGPADVAGTIDSDALIPACVTIAIHRLPVRL